MSITNAATRARVLARFHAYVDIDETGCWLWQGTSELGYGRLSIQSRWHKAHRLSHELFKGPIPTGFDVDHLCRVRSCVNPDHLEAVTHKENVRRTPHIAAKIAQTHCINGHEFTTQNTRIFNGTRRCRACEKAWLAAYNLRRPSRSKVSR